VEDDPSTVNTREPGVDCEGSFICKHY